jgi:hypothetical protein
LHAGAQQVAQKSGQLEIRMKAQSGCITRIRAVLGIGYLLSGRVDGSARWKFQEGRDMGSMATAKGKTDELNRWAEQVGEILSKKAFGEQGPDLQTSLADMEQLLGPFLEHMAAGFFRTSAVQQGERLPDEVPCPTCGQGCPPMTPDQERSITTEHGDFRWSERACQCDRCGRSFFPSADRAAD